MPVKSREKRSSSLQQVRQETAPSRAESQKKEEGEKLESRDPKGNRETAKEEELSRSSSDSTVTEMEEGKKIKAPKKQKLVHEIPMKLSTPRLYDRRSRETGKREVGQQLGVVCL
ncbi:hypoxia up-regulated protein 1-like [Strigops habroptila]|uniref:hypoxia up-regulated protein 1-like n=1 Tax=Strigops habroptila TaxID=2489341 RepID=UPI0011CEE3D6|nr:hypoxia up-regulated protein 1-like [Strigops habroptila]